MFGQFSQYGTSINVHLVYQLEYARSLPYTLFAVILILDKGQLWSQILAILHKQETFLRKQSLETSQLQCSGISRQLHVQSKLKKKIGVTEHYCSRTLGSLWYCWRRIYIDCVGV